MIGPSEPFALISTETGPLLEPLAVTVPPVEVVPVVDPPVVPVETVAAAREIVTLSAAVATPSVQEIVRVTGEFTLG